jgi:hypothetical protein
VSDGAHIALRCIRRFLEKHGDNIDRIILFLDSVDRSVYEQIVPLYFPRSFSEEAETIAGLPTDIGNLEDGEPVIAERKIRINDTPVQLRDGDGVGAGESMLIDDDFDALAFGAMRDDPDASRQERIRKRSAADEAESTY